MIEREKSKDLLRYDCRRVENYGGGRQGSHRLCMKSVGRKSIEKKGEERVMKMEWRN